MKKKIIFTVFLVLLISISGCKLGGKKDTQKALEEIRTGTEGIVVSFLANAPPAKIVVEQGAPPETHMFDVVLDIRNKGAFPQPEDVTEGLNLGKIFLSGYDPNIIKFKSKDPTPGVLNVRNLEGKSTINPNGGQDILTFNGEVDINRLNVEKYEPVLLATACYPYETVAGPSVCIDPNPYSTIKEKKVCEVQGITLSNQGAPVAITKIDEEAFATKTQFKITIKNVGGGDVITTYAAYNKCDPTGQDGQTKIQREDIDRVRILSVKISNNPLTCGPFFDGNVKDTSGNVRLINGEGFVICELPSDKYSNKISAYTTPLSIKLSYGYRNTAERKILIKKESGSLGGGDSGFGGGVSQPSTTSPSTPTDSGTQGPYDNPYPPQQQQSGTYTPPQP